VYIFNDQDTLIEETISWDHVFVSWFDISVASSGPWRHGMEVSRPDYKRTSKQSPELFDFNGQDTPIGFVVNLLPKTGR
jgi:hypothetical protein